jgi:hypothetical protein
MFSLLGNKQTTMVNDSVHRGIAKTNTVIGNPQQFDDVGVAILSQLEELFQAVELDILFVIGNFVLQGFQ